MKRVQKGMVALLFVMSAWVGFGCQPENDFNNGTVEDGALNGHGYVDLGLPSGTLWATCNIGAKSPEKHGDYVAWGETQPKDHYDGETYRFYKNKDWSSIWQLTKYCNNPEYGYHGFTDSLTVLQLEDDAATVNWGEGWCTPTSAQWKELLEYTYVTWENINGVYGLLFSSSGNSLFIPAAGYKGWGGEGFDDLQNDGISAYYWSSTLYTDTLYYNGPRLAMSFSSYYEYSVDGWERFLGLPVRAVCTAP